MLGQIFEKMNKTLCQHQSYPNASARLSMKCFAMYRSLGAMRTAILSYSVTVHDHSNAGYRGVNFGCMASKRAVTEISTNILMRTSTLYLKICESNILKRIVQVTRRNLPPISRIPI